eukprot:6202981-Prymnesium_polylepis.1
MRGPFHGLTLCALSHPGPAAAARARGPLSCVSNACTQPRLWRQETTAQGLSSLWWATEHTDAG